MVVFELPTERLQANFGAAAFLFREKRKFKLKLNLFTRLISA
jgi:hypothetical protein